MVNTDNSRHGQHGQHGKHGEDGKVTAMTLDDFKATLTADTPPRVSGALVALWQDAKGDWEAAHATAQDIDDQTGAWVHAYLHRKEGDEGNAAYWYRRAAKPVARDTLQAEWDRIVSELLNAP